jgi:hypothetical protein
MTLSPWLVYLWGIIDTVGGTLQFVGAVHVAYAIVIFTIYGVKSSTASDKEKDEKRYPSIYEGAALEAAQIRESVKNFPKAGNGKLVVGLVFIGLSAFVPSSKTIAIMVIAPAIVNSKPIQQDLPELYEAAKKALMDNLTK